MIINISENEKKQLSQALLDRLCYCKGFKEEFIHLCEHYNPHEEVKFTNCSHELITKQLLHAM